MSEKTFVVVGASLAGAKAAQALRAEGFDGRLVLIGAEPERPYERPPLSTDYLRGEAEREKAFVHAEGFYREQRIELLMGTAVTAFDTGRVTLEGARELEFDPAVADHRRRAPATGRTGRRAGGDLLPADPGRL